MRVILAALFSISTAHAQTLTTTQRFQQHSSGVVTWGALQSQTQTHSQQHNDTFDIYGAVYRDVYDVLHTRSTYRVRWQDQTQAVTREIFDDGTYRDSIEILYQKTAVRLHDRVDSQYQLRERLLLSAPRPQPTHDPATYSAGSYYFNNPYLGRPSAVSSHDPRQWIDAESQNRANELVRAPMAWSRGWTGSGSGILIMDTGIDLAHPEFQDRIRATLDLSGRGLRDRQNHGTHVAGIAAAARDGHGINGVAFDAHLYIAKLTDNGSVSAVRAQQALSWARQFPDIRVANLSANTQFNRDYQAQMRTMGPGIYASGHQHYSGATFYNQERPQDWARVLDPGVVLTVSAGNQNVDYPQNPASFAAATDSQGQLILRGQMLIVGNWNDRAGRIESARAGHVCRDPVGDQCRDPYRTWQFYILAPGMAVTSTSDNGTYRSQSGSSQAAPVVAGAVAVIGQMWPYMPADQVVQLLLRTAQRDLPGYHEHTHGQGLLDLDQATRPLGHLGITVTGRAGSRQPIVGHVAVPGVMAPSSMAVLDDMDRDFQIIVPSVQTTSRWHQVVSPGSSTWAASAAGLVPRSVSRDIGAEVAARDSDFALVWKNNMGDHWQAVTSLVRSTNDPSVHLRGMWGHSQYVDMVSQDLRWTRGAWMAEAGWLQGRTRFRQGLVSDISGIQSVHARWAWSSNAVRIEAGMLPRAVRGHVGFTVPDRMDSQGQMQYRQVRENIRDPAIRYLSAQVQLLDTRDSSVEIQARRDSRDNSNIDLRGTWTW